MTERKEQSEWTKDFIPNWQEPGETRKVYAAEIFHEYKLHAEETGETPEYISEIYKKELDEETLTRLEEDHNGQDHHLLDPNIAPNS